MPALQFDFLRQFTLPKQTALGIQALHKFEGGRRSPPPSAYPQLPKRIHVHSSDAAQRGIEEALYLILSANPTLAFTADNIRSVHQKVFDYLDGTGGQFKSQDNKLFCIKSSGEKILVHTPLEVNEIEPAMNHLIQSYYQALDQKIQDPLILISLVLMDFIFIHPFIDGNGRTFRLLSVLLLREAGFPSIEKLNLDKVLKNSRGSGQKALQAAIPGWADGKPNVLPWIHYFIGAMSYALTQSVHQ